jgi:hypothetical protein
MWKTIGGRGRPHMTIWRMRISCWIPEAKNTQSQYVIFIALPLQQRLYESASVLPYKYVTRLVHDSHFKHVHILCRHNENIHVLY